MKGSDLRECSDDDLLRTFASRTYVFHGLRERDEQYGDVHGPRLYAARQQRDQVRAEILRRMEGHSLD